jgi:hypothetical protein
MTRIIGAVYEDRYTFMGIYCQILLKIICFRQNCRKNKIHIFINYLFSENRALHEIRWKNKVE